MKKLIYLLLILFTSLGLRAQQTTQQATAKISGLVTALDSYASKIPTEKVHIHFDKPYYSVGDTIWMKAYVVNASNELSPLSKVLHVDFVNDNGQVKLSCAVPITKGLGWGAVTLTDSLFTAGNYHIRAYTNWMRNLGDEYFFDKLVKIGNALSATGNNTNTQATSASNNISVTFFPEGGDLVNGITSKVGFKAVGADGLSREISGYVIGSDNQQVTTLQSEHAGMGSFLLQPAPGNVYTAVIKVDGTEKRITLPKAKDSGYVLSAMQNDNNIAVTIKTSSNIAQGGTIALIAQSGNIIQYAAAKTLDRTTYTAIIPKSRFPEGIAQFTLFSTDFQPVAERLVFVHHADSLLNLSVSADKPGYKKREKVHLDVQVTDKNGNPVTGAFSLAVTDETKVPFAEVDEKTIFSNLLLTADLKGYIEQPNYYFTDITADKINQLDNVMLTQGWRRFIWADVLSNKVQNVAYKVESGIGISGHVTKGGKPVAGAKVFVLFNAGNGILIDTITNADGHFNFADFPFAKGVTYNVSATDAKGDKNLKIEVDKQTYTAPNFTPLPEEPLPGNYLNTYLQNSRDRFDQLRKDGLLTNKSIMLQEVNIREIALKHSSSLAGPGNADQVLTFIDLLGCQYDLARCLSGRLTGIAFREDTSKLGGRLGKKLLAYSRGYDQPMTVIVDGIERPDGLETVISDDVASVEVLRGGGASALYGMHGSAGVINVTTKKGDVDYEAYASAFRKPNTSSKSDRLSAYTFAGYDLRRQFYSPDYANPSTNGQVPDLRSTIYWKPNIITNESGKASVDFFNADGTGNYRVIIEGLGPEGKLGRQVYRYSVK